MSSTIVRKEHFGANLLLTRSSSKDDAPIKKILEEVVYHNFRYPGGTITEQQTWENGGLDRIFGSPTPAYNPNHVLTLSEAFELAAQNSSSISIVIPTFQFFDAESDTFDHASFSRYITRLEGKIISHPNVQVSAFEIGNEYWAKISAEDYGKIANAQIPHLTALNTRLSDRFDDNWQPTDIGIQVGAAWRRTGAEDSQKIIDQISPANRDAIDVLYQHSYPDPHQDAEKQNERAQATLQPILESSGISKDIKISISEFNAGKHYGPENAFGVNAVPFWIEEFARKIESGADAIDHWGIADDWQTNKHYDTNFYKSESDGGNITAIATPTGQAFDLASSNLIGKAVLDDTTAIRGIRAGNDLSITGFGNQHQRVVFFGNRTDKDQKIDFGEIGKTHHIAVHHMVGADNPVSTWNDESVTSYSNEKQALDTRADLKLLSGQAAGNGFNLGDSEVLVLIATKKGRDLRLEGSHNVTDETSGQVDDFIFAGPGNDTLLGHVGNDIIQGGSGNDVIMGGRHNDTIHGNMGDDIIFAGRGTDAIWGGQGNDIIILEDDQTNASSFVSGGEGADIFVLKNGVINIRDFEKNDRISFDGAFKTPDNLDAALRTVGNDLIIIYAGGRQVTLKGMAEYADELAAHSIDFAPTNKTVSSVSDIISSAADRALNINTYLPTIEGPQRPVGNLPNRGTEKINPNPETGVSKKPGPILEELKPRDLPHLDPVEPATDVITDFAFFFSHDSIF